MQMYTQYDIHRSRVLNQFCAKQEPQIAILNFEYLNISIIESAR